VAAEFYVHLWNLVNREVRKVTTGHKAQVLDLAISPDGRQLATASYDGTVRLRDLDADSAGAVLGRGAPMRRVAFSPDGRYLATASDDSLVRLWDLSTREMVTTFRGHESNVDALAFSAKGEWLATGRGSCLEAVADWHQAVAGNAMTLRHRQEHCPFPDGQILASTDPKSTVRLWHVGTQTGKLHCAQYCGRPESGIYAGWAVAGHWRFGRGCGGGAWLRARWCSAWPPGRGGAVTVSPDGKLIASESASASGSGGDSGWLPTFSYPDTMVSGRVAPDGRGWRRAAPTARFG
jgi:WD40 repeat protein